MFRSLLCKLPRRLFNWLRLWQEVLNIQVCRIFGHKWRRLTVKERMQCREIPFGATVAQVRMCSRCKDTRGVKARKKTTKETI